MSQSKAMQSAAAVTLMPLWHHSSESQCLSKGRTTPSKQGDSQEVL